MRFNPNDYEDKEGGGGSLIPAGKHIVTVVNHEIGTTSNGHTQVIVTYEDNQKRTRRDYLICEGKAAFQFASLCHAVGATEEIDLDVPRSVRAALYNRELEIVVAEDTYNGKTSLKVKYRNKVKGAGSARPSQTQDDGPPPYTDDEVPF